MDTAEFSIFAGILNAALSQYHLSGFEIAQLAITSWEIDGEIVEAVSDFIFWPPESMQMVIAAMKLKDTYSLEGKL